MSNENTTLYYYSENEEVLGPFTVQELEGKINPDSLVFSEDGTKWVKAADVPEIAALLFAEKPQDFEEEKDFSSTSNEITFFDNENTDEEAVSSTSVLEAQPQDAGGSGTLKAILVVFIVLAVIGGGAYTFLNSDYYKWKNATKLYCYIPSLRVRSDTTTYSDINILRSLNFGESVMVLKNAQLAPWVDAKIDNIKGLVNSDYLMPESEYIILSLLLDSDSKKKQISTSKLRKSIVNHVSAQSMLNSLTTQSWSIEDLSDNYFVHLRKSYNTNYECAIIKFKNGDYEELTTFIYEDGKEITKKVLMDWQDKKDDLDDFLRQYDLTF